MCKTRALVGGVNIGATAVTKIYYVKMNWYEVHEECDCVKEYLINAKDYAEHVLKNRLCHTEVTTVALLSMWWQ